MRSPLNDCGACCNQLVSWTVRRRRVGETIIIALKGWPFLGVAVTERGFTARKMPISTGREPLFSTGLPTGTGWPVLNGFEPKNKEKNWRTLRRSTHAHRRKSLFSWVISEYKVIIHVETKVYQYNKDIYREQDRTTLYLISCRHYAYAVGICNSCLAWWWRCAGRRWRPRRRGGAWRRQGVEGAGVEADGKAQLSDTHVARLSEERQGLEDRGEINDGTARIGSQAIALRNTEGAAVLLYVGHRRRTHGQQDQHDA